MRNLLIIALFMVIVPACDASSFSISSIPVSSAVVSPAYNNYNYYNNGVNNVSAFSINKLAEIENAAYGQCYPNENLITRVERLESALYNRRYPNYSIDRRINNLIYTYNRNNQGARTNTFKRLIRNLNNAIVGYPTGYTPPIDSYYNYGYNPNYGSYNDYYGNNGWYRYGHNAGTGAGVHIID